MTVCVQKDINFEKLTLSILCAGKLKNNALHMKGFTMATVFRYPARVAFLVSIQLTLVKSKSLGYCICSFN